MLQHCIRELYIVVAKKKRQTSSFAIFLYQATKKVQETWDLNYNEGGGGKGNKMIVGAYLVHYYYNN